ncbi:MAG: penicillin-binding protein 2 [Synergistaceae bacterium]|jgi:cell division protein FtsI (penicillin-binding protein 3)/stage V sporulation protein D (sporulation-specific penicillin-binding protein)|nr:penicillin-binding protein 2 [Synergistaceae bacterium]
MPKIKGRIPRESWHSRSAWALVFLCLILLGVQTAKVHLFPDYRIVRQSERQYWAQVPVSTSRGDIRDRNDVPLAISVPSASFYIDPQFWNPGSADVLAGYFGDQIARKFSGPLQGRFHWVVRKVPADIAQGLIDRRAPGLFTIRESNRMYPHGELASHVIGFCDIDDYGLSGVEREWNKVLYSPPQTRLFVRDAKGSLLDLIGSNAGALQVGAGSIKLTLDSKIQQVMEWKLKEGAVATGSKWGVGICVNPRTGEILAMASYPWIDLNDRKSFSNKEMLRNSAIGRVYEPGSTFKPIMIGIAREMGLASYGEKFYCRGRVSIADGIIRDVSSHGELDLAGLLIKSCNTGMAAIGQRMSPHKTYGMLRQFGFGQRSDVEIAGEEEGLLRSPEEWLGMTKANVAIGQGLAVTPLQLVMAMSSIANGGELLKPYIIAEVRNATGRVIHQGRRRVRNAVLSPGTCEWIRTALNRTVEIGTGKGARVEGVRLAGKTGTAQVATLGEYKKGRYASSFIGFWPHEDPEYAMLIVLGEPSGAKYYGGEIAAPVFKAILEEMSQLKVIAKADASNPRNLRPGGHREGSE